MSNKSRKPLVGGHVSAAGELSNAIDNGESIGATCIQIFGSSPRQWAVRLPTERDVLQFRAKQKASNIEQVFLHAPYLVNLASPKAGLRKISTKVLIDHLKIAEMIKAVGLIFHVGSGMETTKKQAIKAAVFCMKAVLKGAPGESLLIIENAAGGGQKLGASPEDIAEMMKQTRSDRVKVCIDTAHSFEAGIIAKYTPAGVKKHVDELQKVIGLKNIVALHVNDSKTEYNSHHDRHENIGDGYIGLNGFKALAKEKRLWDKAWILEVPGFKGEGPDKKNVDVLNACFR